MLHKLLEAGVRVVNEAADGVGGLLEVVGRNIGRHAYGYAYAAVYQQVGVPGGEHHRFLETVVIVWHEVDGVLVNIREHSGGHFAHAALGITVSCGRVAVHRAEVSVSVHQGSPHGEILGETHHGVIYGSVAVGVVFTEHGADGVGALAVGLVRVKPVFIHGIEYPSVHGFEAIAHVRQSAGDYYRHGVIQEGFFHLLLDVHVNELGVGHILRQVQLSEALVLSCYFFIFFVQNGFLRSLF